MTQKLVPMYRFISAIMLYSTVSVLLFGGVYAAIGMAKNFDVGPTKASNVSHAFYHSFAVQTTSMDEISPKTQKGRAVQAVQQAMAWLPMLVLLAPWMYVRVKKS